MAIYSFLGIVPSKKMADVLVREGRTVTSHQEHVSIHLRIQNCN